jgi:tripartite-type tricarboxylate transporter receptor subunit TctC
MMKLPRRQLIRLAAGAIALPSLSRIAQAQSYPARPVRIIVGAVAGSAPDVIARLIGQRLSERLGQPFVIENREGGNGTLAGEVVVRTPADGYVLLLISASYTIDPSVIDAPNFNFRRDIAPIASAVILPAVITVNPSLPVKTLPEFIAYAKANPEKVNIGAPGIGSPQYVAGELFMMMTDTKLSMVSYRGGPPAVTDAISGQIQGMIGTVLLVIDHVRSGNLRALAVTSAARSEQMPDIPTVAEFVPGFEADQWIGIGAPTNTPADVVNKLNAEVNAALADPTVKARMVGLGGMILAGTPGDFGKFMDGELEKWAKVVNFAKAKSN